MLRLSTIDFFLFSKIIEISFGQGLEHKALGQSSSEKPKIGAESPKSPPNPVLNFRFFT